MPDRAEKVLHAIRHGAEGFCFLDGVPDGASFFVAGIEAVQSSQHASDLSLASFVVLDGAWNDEQLVESFGRTRRPVGKVAPHGRERDEDFVDVPAVVAGVLFLGRHDADNREGNVVEIDELPDCWTAAEQLLLRIGAEEGDATAFRDVILIVEAAFADAEAANLGKLRRRAGDRERRRVVRRVRTHRVLLELRDRVLTIGRFVLKIGKIGINPVHQATSPRTAGLQAGAAMEDDHQVAAQGFGLFRLADAKTLAGGDHQDDRDHSPGDPEHGQQRADAVRPEGSKHVLDEIAK